mmetsp:Transcript_2737/g.6612  ORF Transcript_2737/g.6612 Transcript_2737/m.6612 type:complete len:412 (-) Transcript_2737:418-1653(-)
MPTPVQQQPSESSGLFSVVKRMFGSNSTCHLVDESASLDESEPPRKKRTSEEGLAPAGAFITSTPKLKHKHKAAHSYEKEHPRQMAALNCDAQPTAAANVDPAKGDDVDQGNNQRGLAKLAKMMFSPVYALFGHGNDGEGTRSTEELPCSDEGASGPSTPKADHDVDAEGRCTALCPEGGGPACLEPDDSCFDDEDDEDDFDPFSFMKHLPQLTAEQLNRDTVLPKRTRNSPPITLVLDLDETLVHASLEPLEDAPISFSVTFQDRDYPVWVKLRPGLQEFLEEVAEKFEVIVFTASQRIYAEKLLNIIDPQRRLIKYRVYRDSCLFVHDNYIKELTILGRDLSQLVIVDNSPQAFGFNVDNGIPIRSWFGEPGDKELLKLLPFLKQLPTAPDVRPLVRNKFRIHDRIARA